MNNDGLQVDCYLNINKECVSVRAREGVDEGRIIRHVDCAVVEDVEFVVQPAGRERVRREGRKNVHAFVRGIYRPEGTVEGETTPVTYNPYEHDQFVTRTDGRAVKYADKARITIEGVDALRISE